MNMHTCIKLLFVYLEVSKLKLDKPLRVNQNINCFFSEWRIINICTQDIVYMDFIYIFCINIYLTFHILKA